jgi:hypothetical protein
MIPTVQKRCNKQRNVDIPRTRGVSSLVLGYSGNAD